MLSNVKSETTTCQAFLKKSYLEYYVCIYFGKKEKELAEGLEKARKRSYSYEFTF